MSRSIRWHFAADMPHRTHQSFNSCECECECVWHHIYQNIFNNHVRMYVRLKTIKNRHKNKNVRIYRRRSASLHNTHEHWTTNMEQVECRACSHFGWLAGLVGRWHSHDGKQTRNWQTIINKNIRSIFVKYGHSWVISIFRVTCNDNNNNKHRRPALFCFSADLRYNWASLFFHFHCSMHVARAACNQWWRPRVPRKYPQIYGSIFLPNRMWIWEYECPISKTQFYQTEWKKDSIGCMDLDTGQAMYNWKRNSSICDLYIWCMHLFMIL